MSVGRRLVEERERLGMSQAAFFTACGVSKKAQFNFENDHNIPGGAYLIAAAALGVDVAYVLTGQRNPAVAVSGVPSTAQQEQVIHGDVGQVIKVGGNLDQTGISFFSGKKSKK